MTILWDMINDDTREAIKGRMPKSWKPPKPKQLNVKLEGKIKGLEDIGKDMRRVPKDTRRARSSD